jgi:predicted MPP superfamily phosphohydrolase
MLKSSLILFFIFAFTVVNAQKTPVLKFNKEGKFKIVQFTDVHLKVENKPRCDSVVNTIKTIIANEKPNLVVLTGDVCTSENVKEAWATVTKPMADAKIPWAVVYGNHDHEYGLTNKQITNYIVTLPYHYLKNGPQNISGSGNYVLEVKSSRTNQTRSLLYCLDSGDYPYEKDNEELGKYDWIKFDQIQWYREMSKQYTKKNNGKPYPALSFFHIPLPEYKEIKEFQTTVGDRDEEISSPKINSGMYNAILESKDIMGIFCGHDHNNNYIGTLNNIALAYGCKTGKDSYGILEKGGRVIVLYEGERKFDTWITTPSTAKKYFVRYPELFNK